MALKIYNGSDFKQAIKLNVYNNSTFKKAVRGWIWNGSSWKINYPEYPSIIVYPSIVATVGSIGRLGSTYSISSGTWRNEDAYNPTSYSYQWKRNGANISGATSQTYTTTSDDVETVISVTITATNSRGQTPITVSTSVIELPYLASATVYDYTITPSSPSSVSISTGTGTYSGSWSATANTTAYEYTTTNGSISSFDQINRTYSGTGTAGNVQVGIRSVNSNRQVIIQWQHVAGASSYEIWVGTFGSGSPWKTVSASGYSVGQTITEIYTNANSSTTFYTIAPRSTNYQGYAVQYSVATSDKRSGYTYSSTATITTLSAFTYSISNATATPGTPSVSGLTFASNNVSYTWNATSNASYYFSYISGGSEGYRSNARYVTNDNWGATPGSSYSVGVYAVNTNKQATISWTSSSGASYYIVSYVADGSSGSQQVNGNSLTLAGTNISVSSVTAYTTGASLAGTLSGSSSLSLSDATSGTGTSSGTYPVPAPSAPTGLSASSGGTSSITASWNAMANTTSYDIYYNSTNYNPGSYVDFNQTGTSKTISGLASGTTWYVWVRSVGPGGTSAWSGPATASTTSAVTTPGVPSVSNNYDGYINGYYTWTLTINQGSGGTPTGYDWDLQLSDSNTSTVEASASGSVSGSGTKTVTRNSSTYSYARWRARATNSAGNSSYSSYTAWL
jgi:hypothetical protein